MGLAENFDYRPITRDDAGACAELLNLISRHDGDSEFFSKEDLLEEFSDPLNDFEHGSIAVFDGTEIVGYSLLTARTEAEPVHDMRQWSSVHPDYRGRGIGSWLIDWSERAAVPLHRDRYPGRPLSLSVGCLAQNTAALGLFAAQDYQPVRWFQTMRRDLSEDLGSAGAIEGVEIVPFTDQRSADALRVRNEAFRDHWGSNETSPES